VTFEIIGLDHVQLAMPAGREVEAEAFYSGLLGFERQPKPPALAARGGCWFARGPVALHLGVEESFRPARKAHPALVVEDLAALEATLREAGVEVRPNAERPPGTGSYADDPFGNRLEFMAAGSEGATGSD
jgi:catechol 2,3-dioxygenase-like lactoylglutathione lyase family enzyme